MSKFDILHLVSSLQIGGAERFVVDLAKEQKLNGLSIRILSFSSNKDPLVDVAIKHGIDVLFIQKKWWSKNRELLSILSSASVVHCHAMSILRSMLLVMPFLKKRRLVYTRHGEMDIVHWKVKLVYFLSKPFVDVIVFVSSTGLDKFVKQTNWIDKSTYVVDNGIDTQSIRKNNLVPSEAKAKCIRFGCVGRLVPLKAQHHLIEAIGTLPKEQQKKCQIQIIGDGESRQFLERQAKHKLECSSYFFYGTLLDREDIFKDIDVLVVNSETEGLSIAILEAMAYEKPVIATNVGGNPKLVIPTKTGWLYDYSDIKSLTAIIESILIGSDDLPQFGKNARTHVESNFSLKSTAKTYEQLYKKL